MRPILLLLLLIIVLCLIGIATVGNTPLANNYRVFHLDDEGCQVFTQSCSCFGTLAIRESYPPQYDCRGFKLCEEIDERICR